MLCDESEISEHGKPRALQGDARNPSKFNDERRAAYIELLRTGKRRMKAYRAVGIDPKTAERAMRTETGAESAFGTAVREAELEASEAVEGTLYEVAIAGNVKAIEMWLYNRLPDRWKRSVELSGPGGGPIPHEVRVQNLLEAAASFQERSEAQGEGSGAEEGLRASDED
jgi:hypothetical protein